MDLLQTIFSNNKLVAEAVERTEPVMRRLSLKMEERLRSGGRIFCLGGDSPVPGGYGAGERFFALPADATVITDVKKSDIFVAVDCDAPATLAPQMRAWRRRGMLTACITCESVSSVASASEMPITMTLETAGENHLLKVHTALQMALDALLTLALAQSGVVSAGGSPEKGDSALEKAAASLMKEFPALDRESAMELIQRHGSVRKAAKAYRENVYGLRE
ncbi:MAG: hypothetical protein J5801_05325 [Bacteroidales bacterium]|nr:hypothetical protein [Bacteroidales bacterium]